MYAWCVVLFDDIKRGGLFDIYLSQFSIGPSIYFNSIVKSRLNPLLEPISTT